MSSGLVGCGVIVAIMLIVVASGIGSYNRLVELDEAVDNAWSEVENVYHRRAGLVSNLVTIAKGPNEVERGTLARLVEARAKVGQINFETAPDDGQLAQFNAAESQLSSALSRFLVGIERYPELSAAGAFRDLQARLESIENQITVERKRFNDTTLTYNKTRRRIPMILLANLVGFGSKPYFEATPTR